VDGVRVRKGGTGTTSCWMIWARAIKGHVGLNHHSMGKSGITDKRGKYNIVMIITSKDITTFWL